RPQAAAARPRPACAAHRRHRRAAGRPLCRAADPAPSARRRGAGSGAGAAEALSERRAKGRDAVSLLSKLGIGGSKEEREARSVAKLQKKITEKYGPPENRQGAIEELGELAREGSDLAVEALLMRYTIRIDPGITDDEERARVHALILQTGKKAVPVLKKF